VRANGRDIVELFGFSPNDISAQALSSFTSKVCPFVDKPCIKSNHDQTVIYGTCSVTGGVISEKKEEVIICPKRLYADNYKIFEDLIKRVWGELPLVVSGSLFDLSIKARVYDECVVAFGQNSGKEITVNSTGKLSMDWILQRYKKEDSNLVPIDFIGIEIQTIDTTGNYREPFSAYSKIKSGETVHEIPDSSHGLNWANVYKRLIPQIIRKGNIYSQSERCIGFFFILPEQVYEKFDQVLGKMKRESDHGRSHLSIVTYVLGPNLPSGAVRSLQYRRTEHHSLESIAKAFLKNTSASAPLELDNTLFGVLDV
jgi:hypothetical protein